MPSPGPSLELLERRPETDDGRPPLLFVHGLGHGALCWENWLDAAAAAGYPAYAVSLRGHGGSSGRLRTALLGQYVDDVVRTAAELPRPAVLVGHSMGGLVVQQALTRYAAPAAVLVAPLPAHPAVGALARIARRHPLDAARIVAGGSLLLHRRPGRALGDPPVLVLASPDDALVSLPSVRSTAARYGASILQFPGMGHDLVLDAGWEQPLRAVLRWLDTEVPRG
jgi:pimeloyl-ACP methyl ester carboxylesterase